MTLPPGSLSIGLAVTQLPLLAFALILLFTRQRPRLSAGIALCVSGSCLAGALWLLFAEPTGAAAPSVSWMAAGDFGVSFGLLLDPLGRLMLLVVALISFLVQVYSLGYMAGDPGFSRYYAYLSLFAWAMLSLTASANLLQLYIFWELVGVSSYLLIGFWFEKWSASSAGRKAFVMTRCGDLFFFLGILVLLAGGAGLEIGQLNDPAAAGRLAPHLPPLAAILIFGGIVGKSAQFPLLTWLPDAMEGPTPVSALLHSATMVAAGVFLFARLFPFFSLSPGAMALFQGVGALSLLLASSMALVSRDIKQVWAYSTISQLGFMIMGLAAGGWGAGIFHLATHAGFKALLFLCAGVLIHACHSNDMFEIARRGGRRQKTAMICLAVAAAALAGLPPFSGYFSKERILATLAAQVNPLWLAAGLLGAFLTAYYAFRLIFVILRPAGGQDDLQTPHAHGGAGAAMGAPLIVLALLTLGLGFAEHPLERFLGAAAAGPQEGPPFWLAPAATGLALAGLLLAWLEFGRRGAARIGFAERVPALGRLFAERWYLDHLYRWLMEQVVMRGLSRFCSETDRRAIDGGIDGSGRLAAAAGSLLARMHGAMIGHRLLAVFLWVAVMGLVLVFAVDGGLG